MTRNSEHFLLNFLNNFFMSFAHKPCRTTSLLLSHTGSRDLTPDLPSHCEVVNFRSFLFPSVSTLSVVHLLRNMITWFYPPTFHVTKDFRLSELFNSINQLKASEVTAWRSEWEQQMQVRAKISSLQSVCNLKSNPEAVLQQVNPSRPHCGKTENAADLSARSMVTRRKRYFFFFLNNLTVQYGRRGED